MKTITITWRRLIEKNETCPRCKSTEKELEKAVKELQKQNIKVIIQKEVITLKEFKKNPTQSNSILFNNVTLEKLLKAKIGTSKCCGVCGDSECRTIEMNKKSYESISAKMIKQAAMAYLKDNQSNTQKV